MLGLITVHTEPTFSYGKIGGGGNPFARSATSLGASPHHLPKATSFAPLAQHHSFVPLRGNDVLASLEMMTHCVRTMLCPADTNEKNSLRGASFLVTRTEPTFSYGKIGGGGQSICAKRNIIGRKPTSFAAGNFICASGATSFICAASRQ